MTRQSVDRGASCEGLHAAIWRHPSIVLIILLSLGAGFGKATPQVQTSVYVTNLSGTVSVIDTSTNTVVATIPVGIFPSGVAITPDGTRVYVTNIFNSISVIDVASNTVVVTIPSDQFPAGIAITPDGNRAYVPDQQDFIISVIDTATNTVVTTIPVSGTSGIAITPGGTQAYVTSPGGHRLGHRYRDQHRGCDHFIWSESESFSGRYHARRDSRLCDD